MPPTPGCPGAGPPSPEVTGAFCRVPSTPFSQTPGYALPVHQCRFRVRSMVPALFPGSPRPPLQSIQERRRSAFVTHGRRRNINPLPIGCGSRPRLRGPANPARINLAQEPLDFRRAGFSPALTLLMSAFSLPIPPAHLTMHLHWLTERSATTCISAHPQLRCVALAPLHFRRGTTIRPVSYYAFFKGWLLLSQPPGCLGRPTSFTT